MTVGNYIRATRTDLCMGKDIDLWHTQKNGPLHFDISNRKKLSKFKGVVKYLEAYSEKHCMRPG